MVVRLRKLKRDKRVLEQKVKERTREIAEKNIVLEQQKEEIMEKNKEITDSIRYARRIQSAIMPVEDTMNQILKDYFILYKPKDIVSGDFYWVGKKNNFIFITAADCTGHGVPGAFMSILGISFLTEIVNRKDVTSTGQVLDELRTCIIRSLQQKGITGEQKDGMDIAFCALNTETNVLQFSGANNPLYIIKNDSHQKDVNHLEEVKADKMPVAIHEHMEPFSNHEIQLNEGDCIYLASDGFEDQFGGPKQKKFKSAQLKELLLSVQQYPMSRQKELIDAAFENWKGDLEQVDDVLIIGFKI
jgi:serine phosphatase RsbU (regulator of sigma subunit)